MFTIKGTPPINLNIHRLCCWLSDAAIYEFANYNGATCKVFSKQTQHLGVVSKEMGASNPTPPLSPTPTTTISRHGNMSLVFLLLDLNRILPGQKILLHSTAAVQQGCSQTRCLGLGNKSWLCHRCYIVEHVFSGNFIFMVLVLEGELLRIHSSEI